MSHDHLETKEGGSKDSARVQTLSTFRQLVDGQLAAVQLSYRLLVTVQLLQLLMIYFLFLVADGVGGSVERRLELADWNVLVTFHTEGIIPV